MALTGHLSDLSLSELIEFFCNQRKSGRLKVLYPQGAGYFYLLAGSVVDARIGVLRGCDAVYYALTLPNAEFQFSADAEAPGRTINQPWTQVVLEGLRRLDESIAPGVAFPPDYVHEVDELEGVTGEPVAESSQRESSTPAFFGLGVTDAQPNRKPLFIGAIAVAVVASVAAIGVPAGWYSKKPAPTVQSSTPQAPSPDSTQQQAATQPQPLASESSSSDDAAQAARRQREKEKERDKKARDAKAAETAANVQTPATPAGKKIVVTVTYDESGRVTGASGGDANALRIARQKRFPPGKGGSATVSIPIN